MLAIIFGAVYLLWMYQRVVFGEVSDFLKGLGHHLTDKDAGREHPDAGAAGIPTLAIGIYPALVLDFIQSRSTTS
ncbi:MAG: hypothetical protein U0869_02810 [Chloroflexota bacterium]